MRPFRDLTGITFGKLTVLCISPTTYRGRKMWECACTCGGVKSFRVSSLISGDAKSCGCEMRLSRANGRFTTKHGLSRSPEYIALSAAIQRCKPTRGKKDRSHYYDRGITVCEQWQSTKTGFLNFLAHIGKKPSPAHSLDRIDNDKGYGPGNVRWATISEQNGNQTIRLRIDQFSDRALLDECKKRKLI
jgi:hypothetical protein